jgi:O-antigen ligase
MYNHRVVSRGAGEWIIPLLVAIVLGLTLPGTSLGAKWLGPGVVKVAGVALALLFHRRLITLFTRRDYTKFVLLLFAYLTYRTVHSSAMDTHWMLPWVSFIWLLIIVSGIVPGRRIYWFSIFLLIPLFVLIFSPGIARILNLGRGLAHDWTRESLKGLGLSYIIYSMSALAGFFIAMTAFLSSRNIAMRAFLAPLAVVAFIATITAGSRGGMIVAISGICFFFIMFQMIKKKRRFTLTLSIYLVVLVLIIVLPWERVFQAIVSEDIHSGSTAERWFLWKVSFRMGLDSPLIGWGWESVRVRYFNTTHSGWLQIFAELGLLGLAMEIAVWVLIIRLSMATHRRARHSGDEETILFNLGYLSLLVSYGVWQFVENISFAHGSRMLYLTASVLIALNLRRSPVSAARKVQQQGRGVVRP